MPYDGDVTSKTPALPANVLSGLAPSFLRESLLVQSLNLTAKRRAP